MSVELLSRQSYCHAQKRPFLPPIQKSGSYHTSTNESGCRATWSELGDISEGEKTDSVVDGSRSERPASIADGIPFAAETGEPVPLFGLQEKGWRHLRPPFHIGRAVPAEKSELTVFAN